MADSDTKTCTCCKQDLPAAAFYIRKTGRLMQPCRACVSARSAARYAKNPVVAIEKAKAHYRKNPEAGKKRAAQWYADNPERAAETRRAWQRNNKDKVNAYSAAWREANPELRKQVCKNWWLANRQRCLDVARVWRRNNPGKAKSYTDKWIANNREKRNKIRRNWLKANPGKNRQYTNLRRARKRNSGGTHTAADVIEIRLLQRDKCAACRTPLRNGGQVDHIIALAKGGSNDRRNIQLLCQPCNSRKQARDPIEFMQSRGLLL